MEYLGDSITCGISADCPFLHICEEQLCRHKDLLPLSIYEVCGYLGIFSMTGLF